MWTGITDIVFGPVIVTTTPVLAHAARVVWANLPAVTVALRAASAALDLVARIRALRAGRGRRQDTQNHTNGETRE